MSIELITILLLATFIALLVTGLPLAWVMGATAVIFSLTLFGPNVMVMMVGRVYQMMLNYALVAVPLFIFMAAILQQSGVADQLFKAVYIWSGPFRGGLAIGTIISCTIMAAMVGIVGAEIVTFGMIALPGMLERKYDGKIALGSICAGGGMATLIPPSVVFIVYAMTAGASVGDLLSRALFLDSFCVPCLSGISLSPPGSSRKWPLPPLRKSATFHSNKNWPCSKA